MASQVDGEPGRVGLSLFGGVRAVVDGRPVDLGGPRPRAVVAVLALAAPAPVRVDELIEAVWGDDPPADPRRDLRSIVSRLRSVLGPATFVTERPASYRLVIDRDALDVTALHDELARTPHDGGAAIESARRALDRTGGRPLDPLLSTPALDSAAAALTDLRGAVEHRLASLLVEAGRSTEAVPLLEELVARTPLHEDGWALLVRALGASGRRGDALRCFQRARQQLVETLGIEPGAELQAAEAQVLGTNPDGIPAGPCAMGSPDTRFVDVDGASVGYQVWGDGPIDVVLVPNLVSHIEAMPELPGYREWLERLAAFGRVVVFDKRGNGVSDRNAASLSLGDRITDIGAVMDAVGIERAAVLGCSEGGALSLLFAACHPDRVSCVVAGGGVAAGRLAAGAVTEVEHEAMIARLRETWGTGRDWWIYDLACPSIGDAPPSVRQSYERFSRMSATPAGAARLWDLYARMDVRSALASVRCPVLVQYRSRESTRWGQADLLAAVPHAELSIVPGLDHAQWTGDIAAYVAPIRSFLLRHARTPAPSGSSATRYATVVVLATKRDDALLATYPVARQALDAGTALATREPRAGVAVVSGAIAFGDDGVPCGAAVDRAIEQARRQPGTVLADDATRQLALGSLHRFEPGGTGDGWWVVRAVTD